MTTRAAAQRPTDRIAGKRRLRWQCRRGMRELDLMLLHFVDQHYDRLSAAQQDALEQLLLNQDQILLAWLMGHQQPRNGEQARLVLMIRKSQA